MMSLFFSSLRDLTQNDLNRIASETIVCSKRKIESCESIISFKRQKTVSYCLSKTHSIDILSSTIIKHARISLVFLLSLSHFDQTSQFFKKKRERSRVEKTSKALKKKRERSRIEKTSKVLKKKHEKSRVEKTSKVLKKKREKSRVEKTSKVLKKKHEKSRVEKTSEVLKKKREKSRVEKTSSVRVLPFDPDHQGTRLNPIREGLASIPHKSLFCTIDFLLFFSKSIFFSHKHH
jgi:ATPase subunit of ABC transporter with duplicated ATPase domains